jgi:hypothetical protein
LGIVFANIRFLFGGFVFVLVKSQGSRFGVRGFGAGFLNKAKVLLK